jgi:hypothetical protein
MCTKFWSDGDVHKYFSPFDSPYDAYMYFMNIFSDLECKLKAEKRKKRQEVIREQIAAISLGTREIAKERYAKMLDYMSEV